jgi:hypothetical protein
MQLFAQDTVFNADGQKFTLTDAIVRNHFDYKDILNRIKQDSSFYKAFKTLRTIGYSSYNHIEMMNENNKMQASLNSKTRQNKIGGCRTMDVLEEHGFDPARCVIDHNNEETTTQGKGVSSTPTVQIVQKKKTEYSNAIATQNSIQCSICKKKHSICCHDHVSWIIV